MIADKASDLIAGRSAPPAVILPEHAEAARRQT
jgi:hypothetical protein